MKVTHFLRSFSVWLPRDAAVEKTPLIFGSTQKLGLDSPPPKLYIPTRSWQGPRRFSPSASRRQTENSFTQYFRFPSLRRGVSEGIRKGFSQTRHTLWGVCKIGGSRERGKRGGGPTLL